MISVTGTACAQTVGQYIRSDVFPFYQLMSDSVPSHPGANFYPLPPMDWRNPFDPNPLSRHKRHASTKMDHPNLPNIILPSSTDRPPMAKNTRVLSALEQSNCLLAKIAQCLENSEEDRPMSDDTNTIPEEEAGLCRDYVKVLRNDTPEAKRIPKSPVNPTPHEYIWKANLGSNNNMMYYLMQEEKGHFWWIGK